MAKPKKLACLGECMIELNEASDGGMLRAYGGDSLNTCLYAARLGALKQIEAHYFTALGDDPYSAEMLDDWMVEGIGTEHVANITGKLPGLYAVRTDRNGDRSFFYWRNQSAARNYWTEDNWQSHTAALMDFEMIYLSGISVSILPPKGRENLLTALQMTHKTGTKVTLDINYRPQGWENSEAAAAALKPFFDITDIALPGLEDMAALFDCGDANSALECLKDFGISEAVVKNAGQGCWIDWGGHREHIPAVPVASVVDSTAAGDSFNAGYLVSRLSNVPPAEAARSGAALAAKVVQYRGAIIPNDAMADLR